MSRRTWWWIIAVLLLAFWLSVGSALACDEPLSDAELLKYYKPCYMGWCLRDEYK